jgi:hypothetical protein
MIRCFVIITVKLSGAQGWKLFIIQVGAIMEKKCLQSYRSLIMHSLQLMLTLFFILLALLVVNAWQGMKDLPALAAELGVSDNNTR